MGLKGLVLTANGKAALAKAENSEEALNFECISIGAGRIRISGRWKGWQMKGSASLF